MLKFATVFSVRDYRENQTKRVIEQYKEFCRLYRDKNVFSFTIIYKPDPGPGFSRRQRECFFYKYTVQERVCPEGVKLDIDNDPENIPNLIFRDHYTLHGMRLINFSNILSINAHGNSAEEEAEIDVRIKRAIAEERAEKREWGDKKYKPSIVIVSPDSRIASFDMPVGGREREVDREIEHRAAKEQQILREREEIDRERAETERGRAEERGEEGKYRERSRSRDERGGERKKERGGKRRTKRTKRTKRKTRRMKMYK
jgi:hypothetical protein